MEKIITLNFPATIILAISHEPVVSWLLASWELMRYPAVVIKRMGHMSWAGMRALCQEAPWEADPAFDSSQMPTTVYCSWRNS